MFKGAASFNADISGWEVWSVTTTYEMFAHADSFNRDVSKWDVSSVKDMSKMFYGAKSFTKKLCGKAWARSHAKKAQMFDHTPSSMPGTVCMSIATLSPMAPGGRLSPIRPRRGYVPRVTPRRIIPERELIITRTPVSTPATTPPTTNTPACPKCGTFDKSGRVSCCAPGGAWYQNCGGNGNNNVEHKWFEGVEACERKSNADGMYIMSKQ